MSLLDGLVREGDVAGLPALANPDRQSSYVGVVISHGQATQLAVTAAGQERGVHEIAEGALAGVEQAPDLNLRQIADDRRADAAEGFDASPGVVARHGAAAPRPPASADVL
jgi:hypothetical protein